MSAQQQAPEQAPIPGQITTPNPIEIFWERYKRPIQALGWILLLAIAAYYAVQYWNRLERNKTWNAFIEATRIDEAFKVDSDLASFLPPDPVAHLDKIDEAEAESKADSLDGAAGVWIRWTLACKAAKEGKVARVEALLSKMKQSPFAAPYFRKMDWPPVFVPKSDSEEAKKDSARPTQEPPREPKPTSLASQLLHHAKKNAEFRRDHPELFAPPEPDSKKTIVFETTAGTFKVKLYEDRAPKHSKNFIEKCKSGFYKGLRFHKVQHPKVFGLPQFDLAGMTWLGNPSSKEEDKGKWAEDYASAETVEHEDSGLSHFPFMLAAERKPDRLGSDSEVVYFTTTDASASRDGSNVVFGRVVEGKKVLRAIVEGELSSTTEENQGVGKPKVPVKVLSVKVVD